MGFGQSNHFTKISTQDKYMQHPPPPHPSLSQIGDPKISANNQLFFTAHLTVCFSHFPRYFFFVLQKYFHIVTFRIDDAFGY